MITYLVRNKENALFLGVCSGLADFLKWKTRTVRILFLISLVFGAGTPVFLYFFCAIIMILNEGKTNRDE